MAYALEGVAVCVCVCVCVRERERDGREREGERAKREVLVETKQAQTAKTIENTKKDENVGRWRPDRQYVTVYCQ